MDKALLVLLFFSMSLSLILILYPFFTFLRSLIIVKPISFSNDFINPVSIIIAAFNEEAFIREKISFFINEIEFINGSEIIIISAGSTDDTNRILREFKNHSFVKTIILEEHMVKPLALNIAVSQSKNEILIFSDCRQRISQNSVKKLINFFNDPEIGVVNSTISDSKKGGKTSLIRWVLNSICLNDSISGSSLNIHGAFYAQRKSVFRQFPNNILFDDLFSIISTLNQKKRLVQSKDVIIYDIMFEKYYNRNRIERLARGFIIFLFKHWNSIRNLPLGVLCRFLIYRYLKFLLPIMSLGIIIPLIYFSTPFLTKRVLIIFVFLMCTLLSIKITRKLFSVFIQVNFYFTTALFKYFFLNKRNINWDKLESQQLN